MRPIYHILCLAFGVLGIMLTGCRGEIYVQPGETEETDLPRNTGISGFYLLNEGNMGSNKCSLDYFDETTGNYMRDIYAGRNPGVVKELGDVGNDLEIYGSRLYAVINCSHKVEVMRASDAVRIGKVDIPNCRYAIGDGGYLYVSSYVSPVQLDPHAPRGAVYKVDTLSLAVVDRVDVGYQPEEMAIVDGRLYVANSGGYRKPDYDRTLSVVNLDGFYVEGEIDVAINLHHVKRGPRGLLYVTSRGNNSDIPSSLHVVDPRLGRVVTVIDTPVTDLWIHGDSAYVYSSAVNEYTGSTTVSYSIIDLTTHRVADPSIIKDGTDGDIRLPSCIAVHPVTGEIYIADARNYVTSGRLHCYNPDGTRRWSQRTGEIPSSIAFLPKPGN